MPDARAAGPDAVGRCATGGGTAKFDLTLHFWRAGRRPGIAGYFEYNTDLFDAADRRAPGRRTSSACSAASLADPEPARSSSLPLLAPAERRQVLARVERHRRGLPGRRAACTSSSRRRPRARPDAVAGRLAATAAGSPTRELDGARRASWPRALRALGVGPEVPVAHLPASARRRWSWRCSRRSRPAAPTCRSTPTYPRERLALMLADAAAARPADRGGACARGPGRRLTPSSRCDAPALEEIAAGAELALPPLPRPTTSPT